MHVVSSALKSTQRLVRRGCMPRTRYQDNSRLSGHSSRVCTQGELVTFSEFSSLYIAEECSMK